MTLEHLLQFDIERHSDPNVNLPILTSRFFFRRTRFAVLPDQGACATSRSHIVGITCDAAVEMCVRDRCVVHTFRGAGPGVRSVTQTFSRVLTRLVGDVS